MLQANLNIQWPDLSNGAWANDANSQAAEQLHATSRGTSLGVCRATDRGFLAAGLRIFVSVCVCVRVCVCGMPLGSRWLGL